MYILKDLDRRALRTTMVLTYQITDQIRSRTGSWTPVVYHDNIQPLRIYNMNILWVVKSLENHFARLTIIFLKMVVLDDIILE